MHKCEKHMFRVGDRVVRVADGTHGCVDGFSTKGFVIFRLDEYPEMLDALIPEELTFESPVEALGRAHE